MTIKELVGKLGFEVDDKALKQFDQGLQQAKAGMIALSGAAVAAVATIYGVVKTSANAADRIYDTAKAVGVSADSLQRLGYAAQLSGSNVEDMASGLKFLSKSMLEAKKDAYGDTAKAFRKLGVSIKDAHGQIRPANEVMLNLADSFQKMPDGAAKTALALDLLGRGGISLVQTLDRGSKGIQELGAELDAFGGVMGDKALTDLGDFNDELDRFWAIAAAIRNGAAAQLAPMLVGMMKEFRGFLLVNREVIKQNIAGFVAGMAKFLGLAFRAAMALGKAIAWLAGHLGGMEWVTKALLVVLTTLSGAAIIGGVMGMVTAFKLLAGAIGFANLQALLVPGLIAAIIVGFALLIEDAYNFASGYDSLIGTILNGIPGLMSFVSGMIAPLAEPLFALIHGVSEGFLGWQDALSLVGRFLVNAVLTPLRGIIGMIGMVAKWMPGSTIPDLGEKMQNFATNLALATPTATAGGLRFVDPATSPVGTTTRSQTVNVQNSTQVSVPAGTPPGMVGDRVEAGAYDSLNDALRRAGIATGAARQY